jgi:hypothetical protein
LQFIMNKNKLIFKINSPVLITLFELSEALNVFDCSHTGIMGSNLIRVI